MSRFRLWFPNRILLGFMPFFAAMLLLVGYQSSALAQDQPKTSETSTSDRPSSSTKTASAIYAEKVKEYTTESYFMTELVDHLPISDTVPSPYKILGYVI